MNRITQRNGEKLNCIEINIYNTPTITYYVAVTDDGKGYLFRTLDGKETESDYFGRLYTGWNADTKTTLMLIQTGKPDDLKKRAEYYSIMMKRSYEHRSSERLTRWGIKKIKERQD